MAHYDGRHLTFTEQVRLMEERGLDCSDCDAESALSRIGYYRLSAYTHPMRELLGEDEVSESGFQSRTGEFLPGYKLSHALELYEFDQGLRLLCSEALKVVEVGMRVRIAYVLGRRDTFGHLNRKSLDKHTCNKPAPGGAPGDLFGSWSRQYRKLQNRANDDFFRHYMEKYGNRLPVWIAVEALDFGGLVRLYELLNRRDQNEICHGLGIRNAQILHKWLMALNALRNHCAHHSRLWNRNLSFEVGKYKSVLAPEVLRHASDLPHRTKVYVPLAILAYLSVTIDPRLTWPSTLKARVQSFPPIPNLSPESDMGFPEWWAAQELWA